VAYDHNVRCEWDAAKDAANRKKHGIGFEEAAELFRSGADHLEIFDEAHSEEEERLISVGPIVRGIIVVVCTERDGCIRMISARAATKREIAMYHRYMDQGGDIDE
jgi:uncharacterized protein